MPGKMCHDVSGDKKSIGNWQMENDVQMISGRSLLDAWFRQELSSARDRKVARSPKADRDFLPLITIHDMR